MKQLASAQETLAQYEAVLASTLDPLVTINADGVICVASKSVEQVFGWRSEELIGQNVSVLMPEPYQSRHDHYLARFRETGQTKILGKTREFDALRKDGSLFAIEISVSQVDIPDCDQPLFTAIIRDVTARKQAEKELRLLQAVTLAIAEAHELNSALTRSLEQICLATGWDYGEAWIPDAAGKKLIGQQVWHAQGGRIERFEAMARDVGFGKGEGLPGRAWLTRRPEWLEDLTDKSMYIRAAGAGVAGLKTGVAIPVLSGDEVSAVVAFFMTESSQEDPRLVNLVSTALSPLGNTIERKRIEIELARQADHLEELVSERTRELEASHAQLRQADRLASMGTLAAGLGHDMHNVLLPVRARLDVLRKQDLPEDIAGHLKAIRTSVEYLQHLADGLHLLARDPEDVDRALDSTDLSAWWDQMEPLLARALPRHVVLESRWPADLPVIAVAPHRLTQAILNLIVNAGEAVGENGHVCVLARRADVEDRVCLSVSDNGEGMTDDVRERSLDPFFTTKKRGLGTGLGLSLVHGVVQSAGGQVEIETKRGHGTTVKLTLPTAEAGFGDDESEDSALTAVISVHDGRIGSLLAALLRGLGLRVQLEAGADPGTSSLWVTEPDEDALAVAREYTQDANHRLVVLGEPPETWASLRPIIIRQPDDFDLLRDTIGKTVRSLAENER